MLQVFTVAIFAPGDTYTAGVQVIQELQVIQVTQVLPLKSPKKRRVLFYFFQMLFKMYKERMKSNQRAE